MAAAAGGVVLLVGLVLYARTRSFVARALSTQGTVVGLQRAGGSRGTTLRPVVQFPLPDGTIVTFTNRWGSRPGRFGEGDVVPVLYDPAEPATARIASDPLRFVPRMLIGLGLLLMVVGLGLVVLAFVLPPVDA